MREIKFRAWSISGKIMYIWERIIEKRNQMYSYFSWADMYILMQYTGLKDKNGQEIYEGDITEHYSGMVPRDSNPHVKQVVKWEKYKYTGIDNYSNAEVIGNIYENPELLKGKECQQ